MSFRSSLLTSLQSNISTWESMEGKEVEKPASFLEFERRLSGKNMVLDVSILTRDDQPLLGCYPHSRTITQLREEAEDHSGDELDQSLRRCEATPPRRASREETSLAQKFVAESSKAPRPAGLHKGEAVGNVAVPLAENAVAADHRVDDTTSSASPDKHPGNGAAT